MNEFCRSRTIGFICSFALGVSGLAFVDYGDEFNIFDADDEDIKSFIVSDVSQTNPAVVTVHEDRKHKFHDGMYVKFSEVEGMTELNTLAPVQIRVIDGFKFKIDIDATGFNAYQRQGLVENVKVPK